MDLRQIAPQFKEKLSQIKVALFDVDGVLTNGQIFYAGKEVGFNRSFHASDGFGLKLLKSAGLTVGIITGGNSLGVLERFSLLGLDYMEMGNEDKRESYLKVREETGVSDQEILYMGDELFDLPLLKKAGFSATVPHAPIEVREAVHYVTNREGGMAAAREVIDLLLYARDFTAQIADF